MVRRTCRAVVPAVLAAAALAMGLAVAGAATEEGYALKPGKVPVDEFNDAVKDKAGGESKPARGGQIRVRMPTDPQGLNAYIDNDSPSRTVVGYVAESFVDRDPENFERIPKLARAWEVRDYVELKDGRVLEGRVVEGSEKPEGFRFAVGAGLFRIGRQDVKAFDAKAGTVELADGRKLEGKIKEYEYTIAIERASPTVTAVATEEVKPLKDEIGGKAFEHTVLKNCVFIFEAREGVLWHDGVPFTIDDAIFSMDIIKNEHVDAAHLRNYYRDIVKYEKVGKSAMKLWYKRPYFRALTFAGGFTIFPRHRYQVEKYAGDPKGLGDYFNKHQDNQHPIGTGPYKFDSWEKGKALTLVRNDRYWAQTANLPYWKPEMPYLDRIVFAMINNKAASLKELQNGNIDADFDIEQDTWLAPETNTPEFKAKIARAKHLAAMTTYIGWNTERPFFKDPRVRRAMTMLIDRARILKEIHHDLGLEVSGPNFIFGPAYDHSLKPLPHDVKEAKKLLRQAGWVDHDGDGVIDKDGVKFEFTYLIHNARDYHQKIADIVKESIERANIQVNIKKIDWQVFADHARDHKFDAIRYAVGEPDPVEPEPFQHWHSTQIANRGDNIVSYANPRVDEICERGRMIFDDEERNALFKELHRIVYEDQPWTTLYCFYELFFYNKKFRNVKFYKIGSDPYNLAEWYIPKELQ